MSPQDKVERVLKEIHIAFSQAPMYKGRPDQVVMDRKEFLGLLDRLNNGIFDMMEQYEQTRQSRRDAERSFQKTGDNIIAKANEDASDIYAASMIYTADSIGRVRDLMDRTNDSMNDLFRQFKKELRQQKDLLRSHESELQAQLVDLADTRKYLSMLEEVNREREREQRDLEAERIGGTRYAKAMFKSTVSAEEREKRAAEEGIAVKVHTDSAYFKQKEQQPEEEAKAAPAEKEEEKSEAPAAEQTHPTEEEIMAAVRADELAWEAERQDPYGREKHTVGSVLKTIVFGKDM